MKNSFGFGFGLGAISLAAALLGGCGDLANVYTPANSAGYTPDGTLAIYTPAGIKLYDATLAMEQKSILLDPSSGGVLVDEPIAFDLAADGSAAAVGFSNTVKHDVAVINIPSGVPRAIIDVMMPKSQEGTFPVQGVALSPHGNLVYVQAAASGVFDVASGTRLWGNDDSHWLASPRFSADEATLYGYDREGHLGAFDAHTGAVKFNVDAGGALPALALSPDGSMVVSVRFACSQPSVIPGVCSAGGELVQTYALWSAVDGTLLQELPAFPDTTATGDRIPGADLVCTGAAGVLCGVSGRNSDGPLLLLFRLDGTLVRSIPGEPGGFAFSPDGALVATAGGDARVYRLEDGALLHDRSYTYGVF